MIPILLCLILASMWFLAYKARSILASQKETALILEASLKLLHKEVEPKFTCYYCNNHFPKSHQVQLGRYLYCKEHATRGHSA